MCEPQNTWKSHFRLPHGYNIDYEKITTTNAFQEPGHLDLMFPTKQTPLHNNDRSVIYSKSYINVLSPPRASTLCLKEEEEDLFVVDEWPKSRDVRF